MTNNQILETLRNEEVTILANLSTKFDECHVKDIYNKAFDLTDENDEESYSSVEDKISNAINELGLNRSKKESIQSKIANMHTMNDEKYNPLTKRFENINHY